jgi:hypothetical protein
MYVHDVANLIDSFVFISSDREGATPRCRPPPLPGRRRQLGLERLRLSFVHVEMQGGVGDLKEQEDLHLLVSTELATSPLAAPPPLHAASQPQ